MVCGLQPKDQIEATLGVQMAAIHMATMNAAASMGGAKTWELKEAQERALNRLARTFVAQVEALKRYRSKGEQRVIVERVTVEKGGQAIVGNVAHGEGWIRKMIDNPMNKAHAAPRCHARSKRSGVGCKAPAVRGQPRLSLPRCGRWGAQRARRTAFTVMANSLARRSSSAERLRR